MVDRPSGKINIVIWKYISQSVSLFSGLVHVSPFAFNAHYGAILFANHGDLYICANLYICAKTILVITPWGEPPQVYLKNIKILHSEIGDYRYE